MRKLIWSPESKKGQIVIDYLIQENFIVEKKNFYNYYAYFVYMSFFLFILSFYHFCKNSPRGNLLIKSTNFNYICIYIGNYTQLYAQCVYIVEKMSLTNWHQQRAVEHAHEQQVEEQAQAIQSQVNMMLIYTCLVYVLSLTVFLFFNVPDW